MAQIKKIALEARLKEKFRVETTIRNHSLIVDQPGVLGGDDGGVTPIEALAFALAGCQAHVARVVAQQQGVELRGMELRVEGELNTDVFLGKSDEGRAGLSGLRIVVKLDADLSREEKKRFLHEVDRRCPVSDNLLNATPVVVELED